MVAHDLVDRMLSFEPYLSTPSLSKDAAQNSAYFFRLCFASFFRLFRAQNDRNGALNVAPTGTLGIGEGVEERGSALGGLLGA